SSDVCSSDLRHERTPRPTQHQHSNGRVGLHLHNGLAKRGRHVDVYRIERRRAIEGDPGDGAVHFVKKAVDLLSLFCHFFSCKGELPAAVNSGKATLSISSINASDFTRPEGLYQRTMWFMPPSTYLRISTGSPMISPASPAALIARCQMAS